MWCTENCFQNDPPKVMKHVVRDDPVVHEESTIYARQQAAPRRIQLGTSVESSLDIALGASAGENGLL